MLPLRLGDAATTTRPRPRSRSEPTSSPASVPPHAFSNPRTPSTSGATHKATRVVSAARDVRPPSVPQRAFEGLYEEDEDVFEEEVKSGQYGQHDKGRVDVDVVDEDDEDVWGTTTSFMARPTTPSSKRARDSHPRQPQPHASSRGGPRGQFDTAPLQSHPAGAGVKRAPGNTSSRTDTSWIVPPTKPRYSSVSQA